MSSLLREDGEGETTQEQSSRKSSLKVLVVKADTLVVSPTVAYSPGTLVVDSHSGLVLGHCAGSLDVHCGERLTREALPEWICEVVDAAVGTEALWPLLSVSVVEHKGLVLPGFVDIHTHGVGGSLDVLKYWHTPDYSRNCYARAGTTSLLATVVFDESDLDVSFKACEALRACTQTWQDGRGAVIEGIHAEGPIVATLGGLPQTASLVAESDEWFQDFVQRVSGPEQALRMMTISPSCDTQRGYSRIRLLCEAGVVPALGHDKVCTEEQILAALRVGTEQHSVNEGARASKSSGGANETQAGRSKDTINDFPERIVRGPFHLTHAFNVQVFHHRDCGLANFALIGRLPDLPQYAGIDLPTLELIGDCIHTSPLVIQAVASARNGQDWCMVTDAISEPVPGKELSYVASRRAFFKDFFVCALNVQDGHLTRSAVL